MVHVADGAYSNSHSIGIVKMSATQLSVVLLSVLFWPLTASAQAPAKPNILLIYVDDLGYGDLGSYGHPVLKTPNIDSLAAGGLRFTSNYAPSALCSPSRAGLLTGRTPYRTGVNSWIPENSGVYLRDHEITLAEVLADAGYATAHIGKWHLNSDLGSDDEPQPTEQGFDYFYGHNAFQVPHNRNPTNIFRDTTALPAQNGYTADLYADEAIQWLQQRDVDQPFFLYLSMAEPHTSIANPAEYNAMYSRFTRGRIEPIVNGLAVPSAEALIPRGPGEYYANVTYMDAQVGRVLAWLRENGLYDDTVVVFSSDNGPVTSDWINWWEVNAYGSTGGYRGRKHLLYEGGIRVPAIIRYPPLVTPGSITDEAVIGMDWFVTLAELGGGKVPTDRAIDGIDIRPVFADDELPGRTLFWALKTSDDISRGIEYVVRRGAWKLMLGSTGEPKRLYNLDEDPLEFFNRIAEKDDVVARLSREADAILASIENDPLRPKR
jgi:arylsulfatase A-like enzyme